MTGKLTMVLIVCHAFFWNTKKRNIKLGKSWNPDMPQTYHIASCTLNCSPLICKCSKVEPQNRHYDHNWKNVYIKPRMDKYLNINIMPYHPQESCLQEILKKVMLHITGLFLATPDLLCVSQAVCREQILNTHLCTFKFPWDMNTSCLPLSAILPFPENFSITSWLTAFSESYYDRCKGNAFLVRHGGHPGPSASIDSVLKKSTPGHGFSCSLPSFPILLLFNKAGHCSDHLWLPLSAAVWIPL